MTGHPYTEFNGIFCCDPARRALCRCRSVIAVRPSHSRLSMERRGV